MATKSHCPKCDHTTFEVAIETPKASKFKIAFIRCASCGCVVGTEPYLNTANLIVKLAEALGKSITP